MQAKPSKFLESHRVRDGQRGSDASYGNNGAFEIPLGNESLGVVASDGEGWDHVSVQVVGPLGSRTPSWDDMDYVRKLFFRGDEWVVQYHPPTDKHLNDHPLVLHMWRSQRETVPVPPSWMV